MIKESRENPEKGIAYGYQKLVLNPISEVKLNTLSTLYKEAFAEYQSKPDSLEAFFSVKDKSTNPEQAAMSVVANALLNMDEFL
ncbi:hypothetical protein ACWKSR_11715, partial [Campylobacter fetus subsp. venerealis]